MAIQQIGRNYYAHFTIRVRDPKTPTDTRRTKFKCKYAGALGSRERQAKQKHEQLKDLHKQGKLIFISGNMSWQLYQEKYFRQDAVAILKERTISKEKGACAAFNKYLETRRDFTGKISDITPALLNDYKIHLKLQKLSGAHINRAARTIKKIMLNAEKDHIVIEQDWKEVRRFREHQGKKNPFTWQECILLLQDPNFFWYGVSLIGLMHGLRRDEMRHLTIHDVFLREREFLVQRKERDNENEAWTSKDDEDRRLPMTEWSYIWLKEAVKRAKATGTKFIFNVDNKQLTPDYLTSWFKVHCRERGIEKATPHRLRHSFASGMADVEAGLADLKTAMGHSKIETTEGYLKSRRLKRVTENLQKAFQSEMLYDPQNDE